MILNTKIVFTKKEHFCDSCSRKFPSGTKMRTQTNVYDGIYTWRECPTCQILLSTHGSHFMNNEDIFESGCVNEVCVKNETPEQLLIRLSNV